MLSPQPPALLATPHFRALIGFQPRVVAGLLPRVLARASAAEVLIGLRPLVTGSSPAMRHARLWPGFGLIAPRPLQGGESLVGDRGRGKPPERFFFVPAWLRRALRSQMAAEEEVGGAGNRAVGRRFPSGRDGGRRPEPSTPGVEEGQAPEVPMGAMWPDSAAGSEDAGWPESFGSTPLAHQSAGQRWAEAEAAEVQALEAQGPEEQSGPHAGPPDETGAGQRAVPEAPESLERHGAGRTRREADYPIWERLFAAPYAMPLLRLDDLPTEERYVAPRQEHEARYPAQVAPHGGDEMTGISAGGLGWDAGRGVRGDGEDEQGQGPAVGATREEPFQSYGAGETVSPEEIPPELGHLPPLLARVIVRDAAERRRRATGLPHAVPAVPFGPAVESRTLPGREPRVPGKPAEAFFAPGAAAERRPGSSGRAASPSEERPGGRPFSIGQESKAQGGEEDGYRQPAVAHGSEMPAPVSRRPRSIVSEEVAATKATPPQPATDESPRASGGETIVDATTPGRGSGRQAPSGKKGEQTEGVPATRKPAKLAADGQIGGEQRAARPFVARLIAETADWAPPEARPVIEEALAGHEVAADWAGDSEPAAGDAIADDENAPDLPLHRGSRSGPAFAAPSGQPVQPVVRRESPTAMGGDEPGGHAMVAAPEPARSEEQYLSLLFGSISRTSPNRPELALAPIGRPAAKEPAETGDGALAESQAQSDETAAGAALEELAQQVYAAIKLRLAVEQERLGGLG